MEFLPTPKIKDRASRGPNADGGPDLGEAVQLLISPSTSDGTGVGVGRRKDSTLRGQVDGLLPTPSTMGGGERSRSGDRSDELLLPGVVSELFPTPKADDGRAGSPNNRGSAGDLTLPSAALSLLPTPDAQMGGAGGWSGSPDDARDRGHHVTINEVAQHLDGWGVYGPAVGRWEAVLGRKAPWATEPSPRSKKGRLSPLFVEWMMGWLSGWVTLLPLTRNQKLKILGNGVVPQQAEAAVRFLLAPPPRFEPVKQRRTGPRKATPRGLMKAASKNGS